MPKVKSVPKSKTQKPDSLKGVLGYKKPNLDDEELKRLEENVFGRGIDILERVDSDSENEEKESGKKVEESQNEETNVDSNKKQPAWIDEDDMFSFDEVIQIQGRRVTGGVKTKMYESIMKEKYQSVMGVPKWVTKTKKHDNTNELLTQTGSFVKPSDKLEKGILDIKKMKDLNNETYTEGPIIRTIKFHPTSSVALVGGASGIVSLFQVDGKQNTKLQSIQFQRYPISCASFLNNNEEFLLGSNHHSYFQNYNMINGQTHKINLKQFIDVNNTKKFKTSPDGRFIALCGHSGQIHLLSSSSKELITTLKMNGNVNSLDFNESGSILYTHGDEGEIYVWDMKTRTCMHKIHDDGCLSGTSIAASWNNQFLASGASSGIVNFYDTDKFYKNKNCFPDKVIDNLTTKISCLQFNSTSEILFLSSHEKENAIKLVHCESLTVFSNFPFLMSKLNKPQCVDFSPNSGYFAVGDNKGSAHLFRLKYYGNY